MGLFNHLFKPRNDAAEEKTVDDNPSPADAEKAGSQANPNVFLQPKGYIHRRPTPSPASTRFAPPQRAPERSGALPSEIVLTLGDILSHVPTQFLKTGMHDAKRELRFATGELTSDIARGRPTVPLSRIAAQCPDVFHSDIPAEGDLQVRLPLQKLLDQLGLQTSRVVPQPAPVVEKAGAPAGGAAGNGEPCIRLSLAAILAQCPDDVFVRERPCVGESVRIELPFAPIERQLIGGRVAMSASQFVALLPPALAPHFAAREGMRIPLPLDEIFRNLPGGSIEPAPSVAVEVKTEPPAPAPAAAGPDVEAPAPAPLREAPSPAAGPSSSSFILHPSSFRTPVRPPPVLAPVQAAPDAVERPAEEIAAATAAVEVSHVTAPIPPVEPGIESTAPVPAEVKVSVQPPIRPRVVLPPPVFASATAEPRREPPSLVPPPFIFTAPPVQAAERAPACEPEPSAPAFNVPPAAAPATGHLDQDALQALFMTDETLDLPKLARLAAALPGVEACVITVRGDAVQYGRLPIAAEALAEMAPQFAGLRALGPVACVSVNAAQHSVSYFTRGDICVCAIHGPRGFLPGVREKLTALADALAGS